MVKLGKSPFDDASGQELLKFLALNGVPYDVFEALTASGTTITDALELGIGINYFTTVASGKASKVPSAPIGVPVLVVNGGANTLKVFPNASDQKLTLGGSVGASVNVAANGKALFVRLTSTQWVQLI